MFGDNRDPACETIGYILQEDYTPREAVTILIALLGKYIISQNDPYEAEERALNALKVFVRNKVDKIQE